MSWLETNRGFAPLGRWEGAQSTPGRPPSPYPGFHQEAVLSGMNEWRKEGMWISQTLNRLTPICFWIEDMMWIHWLACMCLICAPKHISLDTKSPYRTIVWLRRAGCWRQGPWFVLLVALSLAHSAWHRARGQADFSIKWIPRSLLSSGSSSDITSCPL